MQRSDIVIVGAGIIGLSIAWQLARRSKLKVQVLEKGVGVGEGSTGASSAICRMRYSLDEVVCLARDGIGAYQQWADFTGLTNPRAQLHREGVLWMPGTDHLWAKREHQRMQRLGVTTEVLDDVELRQRFPALNPCVRAADPNAAQVHECAGGGSHFLEVEGGYVDPVSAAQDLVEACQQQGVDVRFGAKVAEIDISGDRVRGLCLADGERLSTEMLINAAGPWCPDLYRAAGITLPWQLTPVRIQVLHRDRPEVLPGHIPVTVDMSGGIYFRTQNRGQQLIVSSVLEQDEREVVADPDHYRSETDAQFEQHKLHALHHRLPRLPYRGKVMGYCGLYTVNQNDVHPILGPTDLEGFWVANGFSGHGFKLAPAIGSMIAQAITGTSDTYDTQTAMAFLGVNRSPIVLDSKSVLA